MAHKLHESHGDTDHTGFRASEYTCWVQIIQRCTNPNSTAYNDYGGRGIQVCDRWRASYTAFLEDMGRKPSPRHSIDRIGVDGHYEPGNCRWTTGAEQARNRRTNHIVETPNGPRCITDAAKEIGCSPSTIASRMKRGWPEEKATAQAPKDVPPVHMIEALGQNLSLSTWSRETGLSATTIRHRLASGWSADEAVALPSGAKGVGRRPSVLLTARGLTKTLDTWAEERCLNRSTIEERLKRGWSAEDALFRPVRGP